MKSGQPALLYLVPSVLIPVSIVALIKGQFRSLWDGKVVCMQRFCQLFTSLRENKPLFQKCLFLLLPAAIVNYCVAAIVDYF